MHHHLYLHDAVETIHVDHQLYDPEYDGSPHEIIAEIIASTACSLMPIQRIVHRCAYGKLDVVIPPNTMSEEVLVAIPIHMKFTL